MPDDKDTISDYDRLIADRDAFTDLEKSMGEILRNAGREVADNKQLTSNLPTGPDRDPAIAEAYAPVPDEVKSAPDHGVFSYRNIKGYGESMAKYLEELGDQTVADAEKYRNECYAFATEVRAASETEAMRNVYYTSKIQRLAQAMEDARKNLFSVPLVKE